MSRRRRAPALLALLGVLAVGGCAQPQPTDAADELTVFAAASLHDAFEEIAVAFREANPAIALAPIRYDGSATLVMQLREGAAADVVATADTSSMQALVDAGVAADPVDFATNTLVVAVPTDNPAGVHALSDLAHAVTVLCAPEVPCGIASATLLRAAGVRVVPASLEQNVAAVRTKIEAGEADAGLVYATDVLGSDTVDSFTPAGADAVVNRYPIAALDEAGEAFTDFVLSETGQRILRDHGFGAP